MGRPRKEEVEAPAVEAQESKEEKYSGELKACPRCGGKAGIVRDVHNHIRCHCLECGYWDSVVSKDEQTAAESWNTCGDPNAVEL